MKKEQTNNHKHETGFTFTDVWYEPDRLFGIFPVKRIKCMRCGEMIK